MWKTAIPLTTIASGEVCVPLTTDAFILADHSAVQNQQLDLAVVDNYALYLQGGGGRGILYVDALRIRP